MQLVQMLVPLWYHRENEEKEKQNHAWKVGVGWDIMNNGC